jgi:hypothetical protein
MRKATMRFSATVILALAIALITGASRAAGTVSEADCFLACGGQYNACIAAQVTTQGACVAQHQICQTACKEKKH